jgi:hypothetical protein
VRVWTGFRELIIRHSGLLWTLQLTFWFFKTRGFSWQRAWLSACQGPHVIWLVDVAAVNAFFQLRWLYSNELQRRLRIGKKLEVNWRRVLRYHYIIARSAWGNQKPPLMTTGLWAEIQTRNVNTVQASTMSTAVLHCSNIYFLFTEIVLEKKLTASIGRLMLTR